eukprot:CAMPEP_0202341348 /NCGR_PEP_ID=MMETSP1126-20121109/2386_1 /ASSEMBLY_ACC=CAM_ASM_000457 /TAXON_ID=3047 /ORGANISM="Dunaliella tertiolecta, Strain CCMP1320" /LENGTH=235 /DNA_ID=CAMNT_0048932161 /DNA_START=141 /DNA_END=847 /DNA_ORIENTATION=+
MASAGMQGHPFIHPSIHQLRQAQRAQHPTAQCFVGHLSRPFQLAGTLGLASLQRALRALLAGPCGLQGHELLLRLHQQLHRLDHALLDAQQALPARVGQGEQQAHHQQCPQRHQAGQQEGSKAVLGGGAAELGNAATCSVWRGARQGRPQHSADLFPPMLDGVLQGASLDGALQEAPTFFRNSTVIVTRKLQLPALVPRMHNTWLTTLKVSPLGASVVITISSNHPDTSLICSVW